MKIVIFDHKSNFTPSHQEQLNSVGEVVYMNPPALAEHPLDELIALAKDADVLAVDPDVFGGFESVRDKITRLLETLPNLKALALDTTSYGWIDVEYCRNRNLPVINCPDWSRESVAEQAFALLFILARKIIQQDRKTQAGEYKLEEGMELRGKTLGIIGVGSIGSALAQLANGIGMKVIGYNHSPKIVEGVEMKNTLDELLAQSDAISIHVTHKDENKHMIGKEQIEKMKDNVIIVNVAAREDVDEDAMAQAMKRGKVFGYGFEAEDVKRSPLVDIDNAIILKPFAWYTRQSLINLYQVLVDNIVNAAKGEFPNRVV